MAQFPAHSVLPNPRVGAVLVKNNKIVGEGYHRGPGKAHAEIEAIRKAKGKAKGAALYTTLEPCVHTNKRTPPCVPQIIRAGIKQVVVAHLDPNPKVNGKGVAALRKAGIKVKTKFLEKEAIQLNQAFIKNQTKKLPYLTLKLALSFDGKMADDFGHSQWITSEEARKKVHHERLASQFLGIGKGTVEADDPELSVRLTKKTIIKPVVIFGKPNHLSQSRLKKLRGDEKIHFILSKDYENELQKLYQEKGVSDIYIEGGPRLAGDLLRQGLIDRLILYYGRGFIGGEGKYSIGRQWELKTLKKSVSFQPQGVEVLGPDLRTWGYLNVYRPHPKTRRTKKARSTGA